MENHEFEDDTIPHLILAHRRQELVEKSTDKILREERKHMDDDEMREIEVGQTFPLFNFLR